MSNKLIASNYTQIPNVFLDRIPEFSGAEFRVLMFMSRRMFGWNKNKEIVVASISFIAEGTGLSARAVIDACASLEANGWIAKHQSEMINSFVLLVAEPEETYAKIAQDEPMQKLHTYAKSSQELVQKLHNQPMQKLHTIKERKDKENNERKNSAPPSKFQKPTIEELKAYCNEIGLDAVQSERMFFYYESKGWVVGKNSPMKSWQAAAMNWKNNQKMYGSTKSKIQMSPGQREGYEAYGEKGPRRIDWSKHPNLTILNGKTGQIIQGGIVIKHGMATKKSEHGADGRDDSRLGEQSRIMGLPGIE